MDFQNFYDKVKTYALNTQNVESFYSLSPYDCWNSLNVTYGSFNININYIRRVENYDVVNATLYFGQKLKNDSSNVFEAQTQGFNAIINVINHLKDDYQLDDYGDISIYPFFQRFSDLLAGAYADVNIYVPNDACEEYDKKDISE